MQRAPGPWPPQAARGRLRSRGDLRNLDVLDRAVAFGLSLRYPAQGERLMWPFKKKPAWETEYAQNIYDGLVASNDSGNVTALTLRIPTALHQAYQNKILLQREMIALVAISENAAGDDELQKVMVVFGELVVSKCVERGLQMSPGQFAEYAFDDVAKLLIEPIQWAQQWLAEFREDPNDNYMAVLFAEHCMRLHHSYKTAIGNTRRR